MRSFVQQVFNEMLPPVKINQPKTFYILCLMVLGVCIMVRGIFHDLSFLSERWRSIHHLLAGLVEGNNNYPRPAAWPSRGYLLIPNKYKGLVRKKNLALFYLFFCERMMSNNCSTLPETKRVPQPVNGLEGKGVAFFGRSGLLKDWLL